MTVDQLRLNCYVDETGQDARSDQFIVVVVIVLSDPEGLRTVLREAESNSGKRQRKWTKATVAQRVAFIERLLGLSMLKGVVYYSRFPKPTNYPDSTFRAVAEALQIAANERPYPANVFIDGLTMAERQRGAEFLRSRNRRVKKVRGLRDESDELIRLADTFAGLIRAYFEGAAYTEHLYERAVDKGVITEVEA